MPLPLPSVGLESSEIVPRDQAAAPLIVNGSGSVLSIRRDATTAEVAVRPIELVAIARRSYGPSPVDVVWNSHSQGAALATQAVDQVPAPAGEIWIVTEVTVSTLSEVEVRSVTGPRSGVPGSVTVVWRPLKLPAVPNSDPGFVLCAV